MFTLKNLFTRIRKNIIIDVIEEIKKGNREFVKIGTLDTFDVASKYTLVISPCDNNCPYAFSIFLVKTQNDIPIKIHLSDEERELISYAIDCSIIQQKALKKYNKN